MEVESLQLAAVGLPALQLSISTVGDPEFLRLAAIPSDLTRYL